MPIAVAVANSGYIPRFVIRGLPGSPGVQDRHPALTSSRQVASPEAACPPPVCPPIPHAAQFTIVGRAGQVLNIAAENISESQLVVAMQRAAADALPRGCLDLQASQGCAASDLLMHASCYLCSQPS